MPGLHRPREPSSLLGPSTLKAYPTPARGRPATVAAQTSGSASVRDREISRQGLRERGSRRHSDTEVAAEDQSAKLTPAPSPPPPSTLEGPRGEATPGETTCRSA